MALGYEDQRLIEQSRLPRRLREVSLVLARIYNPEEKIFISVRELAKKCDAHPTRISHVLQELHDLGIFPRLRNGNRRISDRTGKAVCQTALRDFCPEALAHADRFSTYAAYQAWARQNRSLGVKRPPNSTVNQVAESATPIENEVAETATPFSKPSSGIGYFDQENEVAESATHKAPSEDKAPTTEDVKPLKQGKRALRAHAAAAPRVHWDAQSSAGESPSAEGAGGPVMNSHEHRGRLPEDHPLMQLKQLAKERHERAVRVRARQMVEESERAEAHVGEEDA